MECSVVLKLQSCNTMAAYGTESASVEEGVAVNFWSRAGNLIATKSILPFRISLAVVAGHLALSRRQRLQRVGLDFVSQLIASLPRGPRRSIPRGLPSRIPLHEQYLWRVILLRSNLVEKLAQRLAERVGNNPDDLERWISDAAFDAAYVSSVETAPVCKLLQNHSLRPARVSSTPPKSFDSN
jgi:hypothetical protein